MVVGGPACAWVPKDGLVGGGLATTVGGMQWVGGGLCFCFSVLVVVI